MGSPSSALSFVATFQLPLCFLLWSDFFILLHRLSEHSDCLGWPTGVGICMVNSPDFVWDIARYASRRPSDFCLLLYFRGSSPGCASCTFYVVLMCGEILWFRLWLSLGSPLGICMAPGGEIPGVRKWRRGNRLTIRQLPGATWQRV